MALSSGTRLGPYEIQSPLGVGGMGEVYRARDTRLDRIVAIKILPAALAGDPLFRERFDREARAVSSLSHPNICSLFDVGHQDPSTGSGQAVDFLVMEYLEGETLSGRLEKGALKIDDALQIAVQIASALDAAHRAGIVHRDLKPGNVILTKTGAKLLDFGLAKTSVPAVTGAASMVPTTPPSLTAQGTILGTFHYMAPEQIEGEEADARTDLFAFGVVLYEMLTAKKAFTTRPSFGVGVPKRLFDGLYGVLGSPARAYDVTADGQRFLVIQEKERAPVKLTQMILVQNWFEELKRRAPTGR